MYTHNDLVSITSQIKKRVSLALVPAAALLALFVYGLVMHLNRNTSFQWLSYLSLLLAGLWIVFCDGMMIAPLRAYRRHIKDMLFGRTRELTGLFKSIDNTVCVRENISFYPVIVSEGDIEDEEADRLFYYDTQKPLCDLAAGDKVSVQSHDKRIISIMRV
jgi:hypothetical protein